MEIELKDVRIPASNMLLGEGRGFEIAQGRLGPGRIHHCMRTIGVAEEALEKMCKRLQSRVAFGKTVAEHSVWEERIARARIDIEMTRLLCLKAADMMDKVGNKAGMLELRFERLVCTRTETPRGTCARRSSTSGEARTSRPCSIQVYQVTLMPHSCATSSRRRPGVRRRPWARCGRPAWAGAVCSRWDLRKSPRARRARSGSMEAGEGGGRGNSINASLVTG
jgi:hypothetical protein